MDFAPTEEQERIREAVGRICDRFDEAYWLARDADGAFPEDFHAAIAAGGWLGIVMPETAGGAGLGVAEAAIMMHRIAQSPGAMAACSSVHMNIFGPLPIVRCGTEEQQARFLPDLIAGRVKACFAVTEPDAGLDTANIATKATRDGDDYVVHGRKIWTSTAQVADKMMLLARTAPRETGGRRTAGLSLFYADLDRRRVEVREIAKMGRHAVDSNMLFIDGLRIPASDRIGAEGAGFDALLHGLNPERILVAAEAVGIGQQAVERAARYAAERRVFDRPIGQNQAIQHPLAQSWAELEAAWLATLRAAWLCDTGEPCGPECNAAKYLGAEAGYRACERAVLAHGGMGYAKEYVVERLLREVMICRIAPVTGELILSHIAERVLGLPKSY